MKAKRITIFFEDKGKDYHLYIKKAIVTSLYIETKTISFQFKPLNALHTVSQKKKKTRCICHMNDKCIW